MFVDGNSLSTVIACQERHTLQSTFVRPHERKNRRSRIRCSGDFSGVVNSICGTVVSARENTQVLRLRVVGMTPERGPRCSFTTAGVAANDISQIVQFGWDLSRVFAGKSVTTYNFVCPNASVGLIKLLVNTMTPPIAWCHFLSHSRVDPII